MKFLLAIPVLAAAVLVSFRPQSTSVPETTLLDLPGVDVNDAVVSPNGKFVYYNDAETYWLMAYDRARKTATKLHEGNIWYLSISTRGDLLAFTNNNEDGKQTHIYVLPLDPNTGLATGSVRRASVEQGDTPSISPDGKWIAFAGYNSPGQRLTVIPAAGGPERVLAQHSRGIEPIRWSPDGATITYGVGGPPGTRGTYKVAVSGGTPTLVRASPDVWPGISPDGRLLVVDVNDTANGVFDATGRQLGTYPSRNGRYAYGWTSPTKVLGIVEANRIALNTVPLAGGTPVRITLPPGVINVPNWSADGKRAAVTRRVSATTMEVITMNADGSGQRVYPVQDMYGLIVWSPDSRWIAYRAYDRPGAGVATIADVGAIELATGKTTRLVRAAGGVLRWTADSRRLLVPVITDSTADATGKYQFQMHEYTLTGGDRIVGEARVAEPGYMAITDSTALMTTTNGGVIVKLTPGAATTSIAVSGSQRSVPSISADGDWMAIRAGSGGNFNSLHVMRVDGSDATTISLPFTAHSGLGNAAFLPGNREVVVAGSSTSADSLAYYRINLATKAITTIRTARKPFGGPGAGFAVSPDGRTLLYVTAVPPHSTMVELDLSGFLKTR